MINGLCLIIFLILNLNLHSVNAQDPEITERILPEIKRQGVSATLRCVVINQQLFQVSWIFGDLTISVDDRIDLDESINVIKDGLPKYMVERQFIGDNKRAYLLFVNRLEQKDSGVYTCKIILRGSADKNPFKNGIITVLVPPNILKSKTSQTMTVMEGSTANLTCIAKGNPHPNVTWVRVSGAPLPSGEIRHKGELMQLRDLSTSDRGVYRCVADNTVRPPETLDITLDVQFRPVAVPIQSSYGQAPNLQLILSIECRVSGFPEPDLQWSRVTESGTLIPINEDERHKVNVLLNHANVLGSYERWFQLVFVNLLPLDYGTYACTGRNMLGNGTAYVRVFETAECQGANCPSLIKSSATLSSHSSCLFLLSLVFTIFL